MKSVVERGLYADTENIMRVFSFCVIASGEMVVEMFTNSIRVIYSVDFNSEESVSVKGTQFQTIYERPIISEPWFLPPEV